MFRYKISYLLTAIIICSCMHYKENNIPFQSGISYFIDVPKEWEVDKDHGFKVADTFAMKPATLKDGTFCRVFVMRQYILKKPDGVDTLEDWVGMHFETAYRDHEFSKDFIKPYATQNLRGIHLRVRSELPNGNDLIQDQYTFSKYFEDNRLRTYWQLGVQSTENLDSEVLDSVDHTINSFKILNYQ